MVTYQWRGDFANVEVSQLHAEGFEHEATIDDWWGQVNDHSLGWVCARVDDALVGFVNVAWDGGSHAFVVDTLVEVNNRRQGIAEGAGRRGHPPCNGRRLRVAPCRLRGPLALVLFRCLRFRSDQCRLDSTGDLSSGRPVEQPATCCRSSTS